MGLLDDAIKEHLELKRRRGADEREVSRLEHEAFGPVRGGDHARPDPGEPGQAAEYPEPDRPGAEHEPAEPDQGPGDTAESPATFSGATADPGDPAGLAPEAEPPAAEPWLDEPDEVPSEDRLDHVGQPTAEFTPPGMELPEGAAASSDDVLEETPEFLQETPEHDRLWFEQKPPRGFDFDS